MDCASCGTTNPTGARFCMNCGVALVAVCPQCSAPAPDGARFCPNCGHALAGSTPSPASAAPTVPSAQARLHQYIPRELLAKLEGARAGGERRIVTCLFCDVQGSTALAEGLDPEEWTEIMNGAFEHLIAPVYRYEGTLARLMGDAILAFFGAPVAHEDDARRAVLAGLEMVEGIRTYREDVRRRYGQPIDIRVGINTGLVVVGEVGSDLRVEYTAMGDAVNLAARMEQTAAPSTVQVSANTYRLVERLFEMEPLGTVEVKGKSEPVQAYRVIRPGEDSASTRGIEGLQSDLVGRDRELADLHRCMDELAAGRGRIVSVMGEAGLGKSRLMAELRASPAAGSTAGSNGSAAVHWYEGRSRSYESTVPYTQFVSWLRPFFGLQPTDAGMEQYDLIKRRVTDLAPQRVAEIAPYLATMLGVALPEGDAEDVRHLEPPLLRARVVGAVVALVKTLAADGPVLLVFEDLHWADPVSLDLIEALLPLTERTALGIVALFRPHRDEPSWRFHDLAQREYGRRYSPIALQPLDGSESRQLVANLLHIEDLPERVRELILLKAEGNPFFVEEVIRSLLDSGLVVRSGDHWVATREIESLSVPDTLAGVLTARLDRLQEGTKRVAQSAAVIGRDFPSDLLVRVHEEAPVVDTALPELQRRELVRERTHYPTQVFSFKHGLTQEAAYDSILLSGRRELHRRVAECLERTDPEQVTEIARHFLQARENTRALPYVVAAGDAAAHAYANAVAIEHYRRALDILKVSDDPAPARRAYEGLGKALQLSNDIDGAMSTYTEMYEYGSGHNDTPMIASALNKRAFVRALHLGQFAEGGADLVEAERVARGCNDVPGLVEHATYKCAMSVSAGKFEEAVDHLGNSVEVARQQELKPYLLAALCHHAMTLTYMTEFDEAWRVSREGLDLATDLGDLEKRAELLTFTVTLGYLRDGNLDAACSAADEGVALALRTGDLLDACGASIFLGAIYFMRGEYDPALERLQRGMEIAGQLGPYAVFVEPLGRAMLGSLYFEFGPDVFARTAGQHQEVLQTLGPMAGASGWCDMGFWELGLGHPERAREFFDLGLTQPSSMWLLERPRLLVGATLAALARNDPAGAAGWVQDAREFAEQHGMRHMMPLITFAEGQVRMAQGAGEEALSLLADAGRAAEALGIRPLVWQAHAAAAGYLFTMGRMAEAETERDAAQAIVHELAGSIAEPAHRTAFLTNAARRIPTGPEAGVPATGMSHA